MSKSILGTILVVVGVALQAIPGIGQAIGLPLIAAGISTAAVIGLGLVIAGSLLMAPGKPKGLSTGTMQQSRLTATLIPTDPRKIVFGYTAMATDVRYQAFTGTNQEYIEMIVCCASHEVHSIDQLWLDNELAWNGTVQGRYVGYLTVTPRTLGTSANGIGIDGTWTSSCTLTGCAYLYLKFKLTGNSDKVSSPFASGVTSRMTIRGKGAKVYDPRLDSTVAGGSGSQRANDQTTWAWDDNASRNPALQELFYELGWKIGGKLAVGKGVPPARLDLASYAVAANACDESIALNGGGTEPRYRSDGIVSEGDDPGAVRQNLCLTMNAVLRDAGGKLALNVIHNDLATPVLPSGKSSFDEDDVMAEIQWDQTPDLTSSYNIVRGRRIDPSDNALYQPTDFPEVSLASADGIDRIETIDLPFVQSNGQAQRIAKQRLQRNQYQGRLTFTGKPSFWGLNIGDVFPFSHPTFGWTAKLFRCAGQKISRTGETQIVAVEENAAIYAWPNNEAAPVTPGTPVIYNPVNNPLVGGILDSGNSAAPGDSNRVIYSLFEKGTTRWDGFFSSTGGASGVFDTATISGKNFVRCTVTFTGSSKTCEFGTRSDIAAYDIPVTAGERVYVGGIFATGSSTPAALAWHYEIGFLDSSGTEIAGQRAIIGSGTGGTGGTQCSGFATVPALAVNAFLRVVLANNSAGAFTKDFYLFEPMVCGAGSAQTVFPAFSAGPSSEPGAEITRAIVGPLQVSVLYDSTGTTFQSAPDLSYIVQRSGAVITSGVTMTWTVLSGVVNGKSSSDGAQSLTVTSGVAPLTITSLTTETAQIEVDATDDIGVAVPPVTVNFSKSRMPAVVTGTGGGGGGTTDVASQSSGFTAINTATFTTITNTLTFTLPSGKTTLRCVVDLSCKYPRTADQVGPWDVEFKVQRGGVDQGSTQHSDPDPYIGSTDRGLITSPGTMQYPLDMSGLTSGTQYSVVVQARVATGTLPSASTMSFTGTVTLSAP